MCGVRFADLWADAYATRLSRRRAGHGVRAGASDQLTFRPMPPPGPPVIREPFTPLPCPPKPVSTVDYEGCLELTVLRSDSTINSRAAEIFRLIRSPATRTAFVQSEQNWLRYRRTSCSVQASVYVGGSAKPLAFLRCEASRNQTHLAELGQVKRALSTLGVGLGRGVRIDNSVFSTVGRG